MELTKGEQLILFFLSDMSEKSGYKGEIDPKFIKKAILTGNLWGIDFKYSALFQEPVTEMIKKETISILTMWSVVEASYKKLSPEEQAAINKEITPFKAEFEGFDGNDEEAYLNVAEFLVNEIGRFSNFKRDLNSHYRTMDMHRVMLRRYEPMQRKMSDTSAYTLSKQDLIDLFKK